MDMKGGSEMTQEETIVSLRETDSFLEKKQKEKMKNMSLDSLSRVTYA